MYEKRPEPPGASIHSIAERRGKGPMRQSVPLPGETPPGHPGPTEVTPEGLHAVKMSMFHLIDSIAHAGMGGIACVIWVNGQYFDISVREVPAPPGGIPGVPRE